MTNPFYTFSRALKVLTGKGIKALKVLAINIARPSGEQLCCVHVVYETVNGKCSLFVSVREFLKDAIAGRKERSAEYSVEPQAAAPGKFHVSKIDGDLIFDPTYTVTATGKTLMCNCDDHQNQLNYLITHDYLWRVAMRCKVVCKHTIATLSYLNYDKLSDYVAAKNVEMKKRVARL